MSSLKIDDLKVDVNVWIQLVAEKQQQSIDAHNPAGTSIWSKKLWTLVLLKKALDLGLMDDLESINIDKDSFVNSDLVASPTPSDALDMMVNKNITNRLPENKWESPFKSAINDAINNGVGMVHIGVDVAKHDSDQDVICNTISGQEWAKNHFGEWKSDDQGFDRRKLRDAIVKAVNLSEPAATRIVTLNRGHSVKELVYMALECRGKQLCSARDQRQDSQWYANHHIAAVLNQVEELMMQ